MTPKKISPQNAAQMMANGALLLDIRGRDEHARERIPAARNVPLPELAKASFAETAHDVIFHCKTGNRTHANAETLLAAGAARTHVLEGGLDAWKAAGLETMTDRKVPIEIMRQMQIAAGLLVVAGSVCGALVHPAFYVLSAAVGAGLMFSGMSGSCAMASALKCMPWNRMSA
jgi:rhodanese-related sulfurtransferase